MQLIRSSTEGTATAKGPAEWFTGDVYIDPVAASAAPSRVLANLVHFMPGARARLGTATRSDRAYSSPRGSGSVNAAGDRSLLFVPATVSTSSLTRSIGTERPLAG